MKINELLDWWIANFGHTVGLIAAIITFFIPFFFLNREMKDDDIWFRLVVSALCIIPAVIVYYLFLTLLFPLFVLILLFLALIGKAIGKL